MSIVPSLAQAKELRCTAARSSTIEIVLHRYPSLSLSAIEIVRQIHHRYPSLSSSAIEILLQIHDIVILH